MAVVSELIRKESDGSISFGDYTLDKKTKLADFEVAGDMYKVKTFNEITKLERNGMFVYESTPGTAVNAFKATADEVSFFVEGLVQTQITLELTAEKEYEVFISNRAVGKMKTNLGGKLTISVDADKEAVTHVKVVAI